MLPVRVEQRHRHRFGTMLRQHLHQFPRLYVTPDVVGGYLDQPKPGKAAGDIGFALLTVTRPDMRILRS